LKEGKLYGDVLDYGCGKCHELNNRFFVADGYDPHYRPNGITKTAYDTIICNFVLNTIPFDSERRKIGNEIRRLIVNEYGRRHGQAFITIRNDRRKLRGWTRNKTWQGLIDLNGLNMIKETPNWKIYVMGRWEDWY
jgi:hypothetical protein